MTMRQLTESRFAMGMTFDDYKDRLTGAMRAPRSGEAPERAWTRFIGESRALQESPFFAMWASAAVDEMLSALYERVVVGCPA